MAKKNQVAAHASRKEESIQKRASSLLTEETPFRITEAYKAARTNITFALGASKGCKRIIITSANPGEGKTTTTINLSIVFAQTDAKVLVIDADLRKPRIYRHLQLERKNGLSDVLCGFIDVDSAIHHCEQYGIDCITSGQIPPNPAELLASEAMENLLDTLSERYDYIFIDTPPVTIVTEAAVLSKFANGVVIITRQNYTIHESLTKARENLLFANAKILGYILNDISANRYHYGQYYYRGYSSYSYEYGYGDSYANAADRYKYSYDYKYGYQYGKKHENSSNTSENKSEESEETYKPTSFGSLLKKLFKK